MADDVDRVTEREEHLMKLLIAKRKPVEQHTGRCLNCEEPTSVGVYCDSDCRVDYEQRERFNARAERL